MNISDIGVIIAQSEGNQIEFKESTRQLERGMETICASLNSEEILSKSRTTTLTLNLRPQCLNYGLKRGNNECHSAQQSHNHYFLLTI